MGRGKIIGIILAVIIATCAGLFFLIGFPTYGTIHSSGSRFYSPSPSLIRFPEPILIRSDIGNINVRYNTSEIEHVVKIDYNVRMGGAYMIGKSITDFFEIEWENITSDESDKTTFYLRTKPGVSIDPTNWFSIKRIEINVTLRTDLIYSIEEYATTSNIVNEIPSNITIDGLRLETTTGNSVTNLDRASIGNLRVEATTGGISINAKKSTLTTIFATTTTGNLRLNFSSCIINGNFDAEATTGKITFNSYNIRCLTNVNWDLETTKGGINCDIIQNLEMGGNVNCEGMVTTGNINIDYNDSSSAIGATFLGTIITGQFNPNNLGGFNDIGVNYFTSDDYSSVNYTFRFDFTTNTGNINIDGQSS